MAEEILRIEHLHKSFGITHANNDICMTVRRGEIRSLSGENGSGKSTLTSIISGMQPFDEGAMFLRGESYRPDSPLAANKAKVAMVVQELGVITPLTGAMNIYLGKTERFRKAGIVHAKAVEKAALEIFKKWNLVEVPLHIPCAHLTMEQRKMVELARALDTDPDLLILDEITQSLSQDTRQVIYRLKDRFKKENRAMIIISHDLDETLLISDTVTVLRDGVVVDTVERKNITEESLKQMLVGREIRNDYFRTDQEANFKENVVLSVKDLSLANGQIKNVSFELHEGEILGVCGLSDAGIHPLGSAVFGITESKRSGKVIDEKTGRSLKRPTDMLNCRGAYLSKNRDEEGLMMRASIRNNLYLPSAKQLAGAFGFTKRTDIVTLTDRIYREFDVKAKSPRQPIGRLSGGNKQKINLGRWLSKDLNYVILDCPTRGVDIGVKAYIYHLIREKKAQGTAVLLITDELSEAIGMADRILVMNNGRTAGMLERPEFSESKIIEVML